MKRVPSLKRGVGRVSAAALNQTLQVGGFYVPRRNALSEISDRYSRHNKPYPYLLAKITGNTVLGTNRWEYDWEQVRLNATGVDTVTGGYNSTKFGKAVNLCEMVNDGSGIEGPGWNLATAPVGFTIKAIDQACVKLFPTTDTLSEFRWFFQLANVLDGECPEP